MNFDSFKQDLRTTEFWAMVFTVAGTWLATLVTNLPTVWGVYASVAATAFYAVAKGIQKNSTDFAHGWSTSEFWAGIVSVAILGFASIENTIPSKFAVIGTVLNLISFTISRAVAKPDPETLSAVRAGEALDKVDVSLDGVDGKHVGQEK